MKRLTYEQLSSLPLFFGMDGATLVSICETVNPVIAPMHKGSVIIGTGENCRSLVYLLDGKLEASSTFCNAKFRLTETVNAVSLIEPQCMFGLHTTYTHGYAAASSGYYLRLPKNVVVQKLMDNEVFRFNFMNLLSSQVQDHSRRLRHVAPQTTEARLAEFISCQSMKPSGRKVLKYKMRDLAECICETRLNLSRTLHDLQTRGLLKIRRSIMEIPALEKLVDTTQ